MSANDPALDAIKHLFGIDKDKKHEQGQAAAPDTNANQAQTAAPDYNQAQPAPSEIQPTPIGASPSYASPEPTPSYTPEPNYSAPSYSQNSGGNSFGSAVEAVAPVGGGDVEQINGHVVGFAFLRYYREHPEIGQPAGEQQGDVGGYQMFQNAILHWDGNEISPEWRQGHEPQRSIGSAMTAGRRTYTVASGDNLSEIAQKVYGDGNQWQRIFEANRQTISDPDLIYPGQELVIP